MNIMILYHVMPVKTGI